MNSPNGSETKQVSRIGCNEVWNSQVHPNCKEYDLFEIGRSHLGNPGVVVGSEARFLLKGMNLALHLRHLAVRKLWDHSNLLPNRVHGTRNLLFSTAGSSASDTRMFPCPVTTFPTPNTRSIAVYRGTSLPANV